MAPLVRTGGSRHTGLAALPHRNIHKERGIKYQFVDMKEKGLSKGEFNSVCQAVGGYEKLIDQNCKDKDLLALLTYLAEEDKAEKILENQKVIKTPIVRNGKQATVGYQPDIWKNWK